MIFDSRRNFTRANLIFYGHSGEDIQWFDRGFKATEESVSGRRLATSVRGTRSPRSIA